MFTISLTGSREGVIKGIRAAKASGDKECSKQIEAAKLFLIAEVEALPSEVNGCRVDATGQGHEGARTMQCSVMPMKMHL